MLEYKNNEEQRKIVELIGQSVYELKYILIDNKKKNLTLPLQKKGLFYILFVEDPNSEFEPMSNEDLATHVDQVTISLMKLSEGTDDLYDLIGLSKKEFYFEDYYCTIEIAEDYLF